jgi:hypothetical protein
MTRAELIEAVERASEAVALPDDLRDCILEAVTGPDVRHVATGTYSIRKGPHAGTQCPLSLAGLYVSPGWWTDDRLAVRVPQVLGGEWARVFDATVIEMGETGDVIEVV